MTSAQRQIECVLATVPWAKEHRDRLCQIFAPATVAFVSRGSREFREQLEHCEVAIINEVANDRFLAAPRLRWIYCGGRRDPVSRQRRLPRRSDRAA